jgi:hypothetical protein
MAAPGPDAAHSSHEAHFGGVGLRYSWPLRRLEGTLEEGIPPRVTGKETANYGTTTGVE